MAAQPSSEHDMSTEGARSHGASLYQESDISEFESENVDQDSRNSERESVKIDGCDDFAALDLDVEDGFIDIDGSQAISVESDMYTDSRLPGYERGVQDSSTAVGGLPSSWTKIQRGVRSMWLSPSGEEVKDASAAVKKTLIGLLTQGSFLIILCGIVFGMTSSSAYFLSSLAQSVFVDGEFADGLGTFRQASVAADFWKFAGPGGVLLRGLYTANGSSTSGDVPPPLMLQQCFLLGNVRLRQLRVCNNSCSVYTDFSGDSKTCYAPYSSAAEDRGSFGAGKAWTYQSAEKLGWQSSYVGVAAKYGGGGFTHDLNATTLSESTADIQNLMNGGWVDLATRVVIIDFTVYNANINLFCFVRLVMEFLPTGGVIPSFETRTVKLFRYVSTGDYVVLGCEVIFVMFVVFFIAEAAMKIRQHGFAHYVRNAWNWFDVLIIGVSLACIVLNIYRSVVVDTSLPLPLLSTSSAGFDFLSYWQAQFNYVVAVNLFFAWIKVFKYLGVNKTMVKMATTFDHCRGDLVAFGAMFIIIFLAFAQLAYLLFGSQVEGFSNFVDACISLLRIILGDVDIRQLENANRILGPIFYIVYTFFVFFVLLNMFLAIVCEAYSDVKSQSLDCKRDYDVTLYLKQQCKKMAETLSSKKGAANGLAAKGSRRHLEGAGANGALSDFNEVHSRHRRPAGGNGRDGRRQGALSTSASRTSSCDFYDDYEDEASSSSAAPSLAVAAARRHGSAAVRSATTAGGLVQEEFTVLTRRVDRMEHSIGSIVSKIDAVLVKLESLEKAKVRRKETMGKLLDGINEPDGRSDELKRDQMEQLVRRELERMTEGMDTIYDA